MTKSTLNQAAPLVHLSSALQQKLASAPFLTICMVGVDRSGSMDSFGQKPKEQVNSLLAELATDQNAEDILVCVASFAGEYTVDVPPTLASEKPQLQRYRAGGGTALYGTVYALLTLVKQLVELRQARGLVTVPMINIFTDGEDTASHGMHGPARMLATECRLAGWHLQAFGIGIDGDMLARLLGFIDGANPHAAPNCGSTTMHRTDDDLKTTFTAVGHTVRTTTQIGKTMIGMVPPCGSTLPSAGAQPPPSSRTSGPPSPPPPSSH